MKISLIEPLEARIAPATLTITAVNPSGVLEGDATGGTALFKVTLSEPATELVTVNYGTADGTATVVDSDYTPISGTLAFSPGETEKQIQVSITGDTKFEQDETFSVVLSDASGAAIAGGTAEGKILDDDAPPEVRISDVTITEGNTGTKEAVFTVSVTGKVRQAFSVDFATADGTARSNTTGGAADFTERSGTLEFSATQLTREIRVPIIGDTDFEPDETFTVNLTNATNGAVVKKAQGLGTITDDEITVSSISLAEGNSGTSEAVFTVTLSQAKTEAVEVAYTTRDGTAVSGANGDYVAKTGTIRFEPGQTSKTIAVDVIGDAVREASETFFLDVTTPAGGKASGEATITNDDPLPVLRINSPSVLEGDVGTTTLRYTVTLEGQTSEVVTVRVKTANGTATSGTAAGADYLPREETLVFNPGETSKTFDVQVTGDTRGEADETVFADLSAPSATGGSPAPALNATIGTSRGVGTIVNDDPVLNVGDVQIIEGNSGTSEAVFTVTLSNRRSDAPVTVNFSTGDGSATAGSDYQTVSGTLTFAAGETEKQIIVPINGDTAAEADESFVVTLSNAQNAGIGKAIGNGTILTDDTQLQINDVQIVEGNAGTSLVIFTVQRTGGLAHTSTVKYATANGTATASGDNADYVAKTGTLTFAANQSSATVAIEVRGDLRGEFDEQFFVNLTESTGGIIGRSQGIGTIVNDDTPALRINDVSVFEGNDSTRVARFTLTLAAQSDKEVTVNFATTDGTAIAGSDYVATSGTVTFAPGVTSRTIDVPIIGDAVDEVDESFTLNLSGATNAVIEDAQGIGTIRNDDITVSIGNVSLAEGNSGTTNAVFTVALSAASAHPVTVTVSTQDGTAKVGDNDYTSTTSTLTFAPGVTSQTFVVPVRGDTKDEGNETFAAVLSNVQNAQIAEQGSGTATIVNDDTATLSIADVVVAEGDASSTGAPIKSNAIFTVRLSNPSAEVVTVRYTTQDGTATTADADYSATSGTLTFAPGEVEKTISVSINGDDKAELDETFFIKLSEPTNAALPDDTAVGTIRDARTIAIADLREAEGNGGPKIFKFVVTLDRAAEQPISVDYTTVDRTATAADGDYVPVSGTLNFAVGEKTREIEVTINGDTKVEPDETFLVRLSNPTGATLVATQATGTIANDESVINIVSSTNPATSTIEVTEGNPGDAAVKSAVFTVTRTNGATAASVQYATVAGSAGTADFTPVSGTLSFAAGELSKTISVPITRDLNKENNESFTVKLSNSTNAVIGQDTGTVMIIDDDAAPTLSIADVETSEGNTGKKNMVFTVKLSAANETAPVTVKVNTRDGTAVSTLDYQPPQGEGANLLTFAPGETSRTFIVQVVGDALDEGASEVFFVDLTEAQNAEISRATATGTILDDDAAPRITIGDVSIAEGNEGTRLATFTVNLSAASGRAVTVRFATEDQTATSVGAAADFEAATGLVTFEAGETEKTVTVPIFGDAIFESGETFAVRLSEATNAVLSDDLAIGTITNDDPAPVVAINNITVQEGNDGRTMAVFTVTLAGRAQSPVTVNFTTEDGNAKDGINDGKMPADYEATTGTLTFGAGETSKTIEVPVFGDLFKEGDETFSVRLSGAANATIASGAGTGTATITDDGDTAVGIFVNDVQVVEGNSSTTKAIFRVELTGPSSTGTTFTASTINGTASSRDNDFVEVVNRPGSIAAGQTTFTYEVLINGDTDFEGGVSETFSLALSNISPNVIPVAGAIGTGTIYTDDLTQLNATTIQYIDVDGDLVTVKFSKGTLNINGQFVFRSEGSVGGRQLQLIDLTRDGRMFSGASISITAEPQLIVGRDGVTTLGDGRVNVGYIQAAIVQPDLLEFTSGIDLGRVKIEGDLGKIIAGDPFTSAAIKKLDVGSLGTRGTATGAPDINSATLSGINNVVVRGDFAGSLTVLGNSFGKINKLTIDGALRGGSASGSAQIFFTGSIGKATIGSIIGGSGSDSASLSGSTNSDARIGSIKILGDIVGGSGSGSGRIVVPKIGNVTAENITGGAGANSGGIFAGKTLGRVSISGGVDDGDVTGGSGNRSGQIASEGKIKSVKLGGSLSGAAGEASGAIVARGAIESIAVLDDITGGSGNRSGIVQVDAAVNRLQLGQLKNGTHTNGDLRGGTGASSGQIVIDAGVKNTTIHGSIIGGTGTGSGGLDVGGTLEKIVISGNIQGANATTSAIVVNSGFVAANSIRTMSLEGDLISGTANNVGIASSGTIRVVGELRSLDIGGSIIGNSTNAAVISAGGVASLMAIKSLRVGGSVSFADILAGYSVGATVDAPRGRPINPDAQIGTVTIGGDVQGVNIVAGADAGADRRFGTADDTKISAATDSAKVISKIASVVIRGSVDATDERYGIVAQHVVSVKAGPSNVSLTPGPGNDRPAVEVSADSNLRVLELPL